jgi:UDP-N-acetylglucosamine diphosphorylase/glucosamine-1-phosphate N-acetyltransferase
MNQISIIILAAGMGTRMKSNIPKVLHLFEDKPMLVRIVETAFKLKPSKIIIVTGKYHDLIKSTIDDYFNFENIIEFVIQKEPLGTGDAIRCCLPIYDKDDKVLILNGDMPLINKDILEKFIKNVDKYDINILIAKLENPYGYGRIILNEKNEFIEIIEEKDCSEKQKEIKLINSGLYYITSKLLQLYVPYIENVNNQKEYYLTDIVKIIKQKTNQNIKTYLIDESENKIIYGVNTKEELSNLQNLL